MSLPPKNRFEEYFNYASKGGYISLEIAKERVDNLVTVCKPSAEETKLLYDTFNAFWGGLGLIPGKKMTKEQFVDGSCRLAEQEMKTKASGGETIMRKHGRALFDVIDTNNDGTVSLEELTVYLAVFGLDETWAEREFKVIDTNKNGKIEIEEYLHYIHEYWWKGEL